MAAPVISRTQERHRVPGIAVAYPELPVVPVAAGGVAEVDVVTGHLDTDRITEIGYNPAPRLDLGLDDVPLQRCLNLHQLTPSIIQALFPLLPLCAYKANPPVLPPTRMEACLVVHPCGVVVGLQSLIHPGLHKGYGVRTGHCLPPVWYATNWAATKLSSCATVTPCRVQAASRSSW